MSITFGAASAPSQITTRLDALFAQSLALYKDELFDAVSESNALFYEMKKAGMWKKKAGSAYIAVDLMYALGAMEPYDGYDELEDTPLDGITQAVYEWRQTAVPITYSEKERKQNKHRILDLVKSKLKQAKMGAIESVNKQILLGSLAGSGASLLTPYTNAANGASSFDPLPLLVSYDPTASTSIGNINQNTYSWWRNRTKTSAATTYLGLLLEFDNMYNTCGRGPGGSPKLILVDQVTFELINAAYYEKFRIMMQSDGNYPFENLKFRQARIVYDQFVGDVANDVANTTTKGTAYFLHPEMLEMIVEEETDLALTEFAKPPKGDSRLAHILLMAQLTVNNRKKLGVIGNIARTLT